MRSVTRPFRRSVWEREHIALAPTQIELSFPREQNSRYSRSNALRWNALRPLCGPQTKTRPAQFQNKNSLDTLVPTLCVGMPLGRSAAREPNQARIIPEQELSRYSRSNALRWNAPRPLCGPRTKIRPSQFQTRTLSILSFQRSALECSPGRSAACEPKPGPHNSRTRTLSILSFQRSALECPSAALRPANQNQALTIPEQKLSRYSRSNALRWNAPRPLCGPQTKPGPHNSRTRNK